MTFRYICVALSPFVSIFLGLAIDVLWGVPDFDFNFRDNGNFANRIGCFFWAGVLAIVLAAVIVFGN